MLDSRDQGEDSDEDEKQKEGQEDKRKLRREQIAEERRVALEFSQAGMGRVFLEVMFKKKLGKIYRKCSADHKTCREDQRR